VRRSQPQRDWTRARLKADAGCRLCGEPAEAAHIVARDRDMLPPLDPDVGWAPFSPWLVAPDRIVGLCPQHHRLYDAHRLDLLEHLTTSEQAQAVADTGSIETARRRLGPSADRQPSLFDKEAA
jgi:hypothetical protein